MVDAWSRAAWSAALGLTFVAGCRSDRVVDRQGAAQSAGVVEVSLTLPAGVAREEVVVAAGRLRVGNRAVLGAATAPLAATVATGPTAAELGSRPTCKTWWWPAERAWGTVPGCAGT